jgi:hypothetical protein
MAIFGDFPAEARDGLGRVGLATVLDGLADAADEFVQSEQAFRREQRVRVIGFVATDSERLAEAQHNAAGLQHLEGALTRIRNVRQQLDAGLVARLDTTVRSEQGRQALASSRGNFAHQLSEQDVPIADFQEILKAWDSQSGQVAANGFSGLLTELEASAARLKEVRNQPNRGREAGSPLPLWKIILIASTILVSLAAVIACFVWFGCGWIMAYLKVYAPALSALILMGC